MHRLLAVVVVGLGWLVLAGNGPRGWAQVPGGRPAVAPRSKNAVDVRQPWSELSTPLAPAIVEICNENRLCSLGTVVAPQGLIVAKASELKDKPQLVCKLFDGRQFQPTLVRADETLDLALLKIDAVDLTPVELAAEAKIGAGNFVLCVGPNANPLGFGIVEVDPRSFRFPRQRNVAPRGYLGVQSHTDPQTNTVVVDNVEDDGAARRAGMRKGDVIRSINGQAIHSREQLVRTLREFKSGETIDLVLVRSNLEITIQPKLGDYPNRDPLTQWGGGPFNERRYGFDEVIVHDTVIPTNHCGGPLLDSQGRVIGINIARALRVATYAIPAAKIAAFIEPDKISPPGTDSPPTTTEPVPLAPPSDSQATTPPVPVAAGGK